MDRDGLILSLLPVCGDIARRYPPPYAERMQDGMTGAIQAVDSYDPASGTSLATWAHHRIRWAILDGYRREDHLTRREREGGCSAPRPLPLPEHFDETWPHEEPGYAVVENVQTLARLLPLLTARERYVLGAYYWQHRPQAVIGADLGISESLVSRIRSGALARLRATA